MRILSFTLFFSMLSCFVLHLAGCDRQVSDATVGVCDVSPSVPVTAESECPDRPRDLHVVVASIAENDLELAAWVLEMWRQEASQDTWGRLKYCLTLEEPERSECLRRVKGDD